MTEELKIVIKAVTDEAKRKIKGIREEIKKAEEKSKEAGEKTKEMFGGIVKGAAAAVAALVALTAAMVTLGKSTEEFRKAQAKVNATFQSMGSSTEQASATFRSLFRVLGDNDRAAETAQSLALITTNEKELAQWTNIMQGVYASMGDKLPVESLAEAANETIRVGKVTGTMADALNWLGVSEDAFNESLANTVTYEEREALVRSTLNGLYSTAAANYEANNSAMLAYNDSQYSLNEAMAEAAKYTVPLMTNINNLGAAFFNTFAPAIQTACAYLAVLVNWLSTAVAWIGNLFGLVSSDSSISDTVSEISEKTKNATKGVGKVGDEFKKAAGQAKELKKQTMGFDELNVVSNPASASGGGASTSGGGGGGSIPTIDSSAFTPDLTGFRESMAEAKEKLEAILLLVGLVGLGFAAWKILGIADFASFLGVLKNIAGWAMIIAGAILLIKGFTDAWVNGVDWQNFAEMLGGIALIAGGLGLIFGATAAGIALVIGGILLLVVGIKDLIENGYSMEAVITVATGAILLIVGAILLFNASLLANPITWIIIAIVALVAAFVVLWNECDAFRNFWINLWEGIKKVFGAVWEWIKNFFTVTLPNIFWAVINFVKENWQALLLLLVNPFAAAFKLLYDNCDGFRDFIDKWVAKIAQFFKNLWSSIKNIFASVGQWFSDIFTGAWNGIKKAFSAVGSFFSGIWESIKGIFADVGSAIADAVTNTVKSAINGVLSKAIKIINGFISAINLAIEVINAIPGVSIKKLTKLEVPKLATGGILTRESLFIGGEGGKKEAVLPLEQNTEWMDVLADRINKNGAPSKIVLTIDGRELGWASVNNINSITKQTGSIPLVLA